jgi:hypothetical protein
MSGMYRAQNCICVSCTDRMFCFKFLVAFHIRRRGDIDSYLWWISVSYDGSHSLPFSSLLTLHTKSVCNEMPLKSLSCGKVCNIYRDKRKETRCYSLEDTVRGTGEKACSLLKFMEPGTHMKQ